MSVGESARRQRPVAGDDQLGGLAASTATMNRHIAVLRPALRMRPAPALCVRLRWVDRALGRNGAPRAMAAGPALGGAALSGACGGGPACRQSRPLESVTWPRRRCRRLVSSGAQPDTASRSAWLAVVDSFEPSISRRSHRRAGRVVSSSMRPSWWQSLPVHSSKNPRARRRRARASSWAELPSRRRPLTSSSPSWSTAACAATVRSHLVVALGALIGPLAGRDRRASRRRSARPLQRTSERRGRGRARRRRSFASSPPPRWKGPLGEPQSRSMTRSSARRDPRKPRLRSRGSPGTAIAAGRHCRARCDQGDSRGHRKRVSSLHVGLLSDG